MAGCGTSNVQVFSLNGPDGGGSGADAGIEASVAPPGDAAADVVPLTAREQFCSGTGPPEIVADTDAGTVSTCLDQLAQKAFRYALCACDKFVSTGTLQTTGYDSTMGPPSGTNSSAAGSVGTNGNFAPSGLVSINGSLWASATAANLSTSDTEITGDLHAASEFTSSGDVTVGGSAYLAGGIQTTGGLSVMGALDVPSGQQISVGGAKMYPTPVATSVKVPQACDCAASDFVDIPSAVKAYENVNDDGAIRATALEHVPSTQDGMLDLLCGHYYFTSITSDSVPIVIQTFGRVVIFVQGDISMNANLSIVVNGGSDGTEGEVDLFVAGNITFGGGATFSVGNPNSPAHARTYVGGDTVDLQGSVSLSGNLYAPNASVTLGTMPATLFGALFAKQVNANADLSIYYDTSILTPSPQSCPAPTSCTSCNDCNGQACVADQCGACRSDTDCCLPLVCGPGGACIPDVTIPR